MSKHPIPKDPHHQRFADLVLEGKSFTDAYLGAGYKVNRVNAASAGKRMRKRLDVEAYIQSIQAQAADDSVLTLLEKRRFLARIVRTGLASIDPADPDDKNADLVKSYASNESESSSSTRFEKHDPLKAIEIDNKLDASSPENESAQELTNAILALAGKSVLPEDRM
jgi:phage terminase small subunit